MYDIQRLHESILLDLQHNGLMHTIFTSYPWIQFLKKNQNIEPVILKLSLNNITYSYFVGGIVNKFGIKILGSPFEGWLTCDMGFICVNDFNYTEGLLDVKNYAFNTLKCMYVQITDKKIHKTLISDEIKFFETDTIIKNISGNEESILNSFTKQGRRYIRQFYEREDIKQVQFNHEFIDTYYEQFEAIFYRQGLIPNFTKQKIYDLAEAFKDYPELLFAQKAFSKGGNCNGTAFTFGLGEWCYYLCAAHNREHNNNHPGEGLFWEMIRHWHIKGITKLDLVGIRDYKMRYNPEITKIVTVYFEKLPGLLKTKNLARKIIELLRNKKYKIKRDVNRTGS